MTVASFRAKVVEVITEVFDTLTSYIFRPGEAESAPLSEVEFGWLPDNLQDVFTDETDEFRHLRFEFSDGKFISYSQLCLSDNTKTIVKLTKILKLSQLKQAVSHVVPWDTACSFFVPS